MLRLRFREIKGNSQQDAVSGELCVVMPGIIARFDGSDIQVSFVCSFVLLLIYVYESAKSWCFYSVFYLN